MGGATGTGRPGMHTSRKLLQQVRRALVAAFVLGGAAFLLQMALPLYALHVVEGAVAAASFETLALLSLIAAIAAGAAIALAAARDRILLRAGLWLDHTLGHHMLANGARLGTAPAELKKNADALALLSGALADRAIVAALEALWVPVVLVALALLHPIIGAVAAVFASLLLLAMLKQAAPIRRLAEQKAKAGENTATWWLAETLGPADARLAAGVADGWERLNRAHIAAAYALGSRIENLSGLARLIRAGAQVALIGVGAWLVIDHQLSLAALLACVLLNILLLEPLTGLAKSLPTVASAMSAYRQLGALPADAQDERPARKATSPFVPAPRLNVRGPLALGLAMILLVVVAGLGARHTRLSDLAELTGGAIFETRVTTLHAEDGPAARMHIAPGALVKAGDLLLTRDTSELDRQIAMLKALAEAARSQLALVGREAAAMPAPGALLDSDRPKLASLEQRIAELEKESAELTQRLALAERELARSQLRSPVSGRVLVLNVHGADTPSAPRLVDLQIVTANRPLLYRLLDPVRRSNRPTSTARSVADLEKDP
jgi:hypothetical protein